MMRLGSLILLFVVNPLLPADGSLCMKNLKGII
jgi:hypothetical protein